MFANDFDFPIIYPSTVNMHPSSLLCQHQHSLEKQYANIVIHSGFCGIKSIIQGQWGPTRQTDQTMLKVHAFGQRPILWQVDAGGGHRGKPAPYTTPNAKKNDLLTIAFFIQPFSKVFMDARYHYSKEFHPSFFRVVSQ